MTNPPTPTMDRWTAAEAIVQRLLSGCVYSGDHFWIVDSDGTDAVMSDAAVALQDLITSARSGGVSLPAAAQPSVPTAQADRAVLADDGWIEWDGGVTNTAPVKGPIEWRNKHGDSEVFHDATKVDGWIKGHRYQIVAYRSIPHPAKSDSSTGGES